MEEAATLSILRSVCLALLRLIESPALGTLCTFVVCQGFVVFRNNSVYAGSDKMEWLGAAGLGLPGFGSFVRKESADVLKDGGLS